MTEADAIQTRLSAMRHIEAAGPRGLGADVIMASLNDEGWRVTAEQTMTILHWLLDRELVIHKRRDVSHTRPRYALTAAGLDALAREQDPFAE